MKRCMPHTILALVLLSGCGPMGSAAPPPAARGKADTGWVADTSYEVGADISGQITVEAGDHDGLATDRALQEQLVDDQIKFGKTTLADHGYHLNQLVEAVQIEEVSTDPEQDTVTIAYRARVDLIHSKWKSDPVPTLEELGQLEHEVPLPLDPRGVYYRNHEDCASGWGDHTLADYNYYYYFAPDKETCTEPLHKARLTLREVYPVTTVYPEYDRLLTTLEGDAVGFRAAILPNRGDDDPLSRFDAHRSVIEGSLGLEGEEQDSGKYIRYSWTAEGATMVIDLYDPTRGWFTSTFRDALGSHQLVFYNGHSAYGTQPFLTEADAFSDGYQIVGMHSCRSYPYYTRQVFRAKATAEDPTGFSAADVVATGKSSYPYDSPKVMEALLQGLMDGISAVQAGRESEAPSWQSIVARMNSAAWGILYGAAGVRDNAWQPQAEPTE